jgi:RimJ/RimL family protein N-acetyltransferase
VPVELRTERLLLRRWRDEDREPFAALNADPRVMEHFPGLMTREASDAFVDRITAGLEANGFGLWAVEVPSDAPFIGFVGLSVPSFEAHFTPAVEVGWRLAAESWGHGYATEAARASLAHGFGTVGLDEIVSFTVPANRRSRAVMERIGMRHDEPGDFEHPNLPESSPLRRHVLYRLGRDEWLSEQRARPPAPPGR